MSDSDTTDGGSDGEYDTLINDTIDELGLEPIVFPKPPQPLTKPLPLPTRPVVPATKRPSMASMMASAKKAGEEKMKKEQEEKLRVQEEFDATVKTRNDKVDKVAVEFMDLCHEDDKIPQPDPPAPMDPLNPTVLSGVVMVMDTREREYVKTSATDTYGSKYDTVKRVERYQYFIDLLNSPKVAKEGKKDKIFVVRKEDWMSLRTHTKGKATDTPVTASRPKLNPLVEQCLLNSGLKHATLLASDILILRLDGSLLEAIEHKEWNDLKSGMFGDRYNSFNSQLSRLYTLWTGRVLGPNFEESEEEKPLEGQFVDRHITCNVRVVVSAVRLDLGNGQSKAIISKQISSALTWNFVFPEEGTPNSELMAYHLYRICCLCLDREERYRRSGTKTSDLLDKVAKTKTSEMSERDYMFVMLRGVLGEETVKALMASYSHMRELMFAGEKQGASAYTDISMGSRNIGKVVGGKFYKGLGFGSDAMTMITGMAPNTEQAHSPPAKKKRTLKPKKDDTNAVSKKRKRKNDKDDDDDDEIVPESPPSQKVNAHDNEILTLPVGEIHVDESDNELEETGISTPPALSRASEERMATPKTPSRDEDYWDLKMAKPTPKRENRITKFADRLKKDPKASIWLKATHGKKDIADDF